MHAPFGPFVGPIYVPGGPHGLMKCPSCDENTPDAWQFLIVEVNPVGRKIYLEAPQAHATHVALDWMRCANEKCGELVIRIHESYVTNGGGGPPFTVETASWVARPRGIQRHVDPLVPPELRADYQEAAALLDLSPRMSAVLSRRILSDLLRRYANTKSKYVTPQIEEFARDVSHPRKLRESLHHFREVGDFAAHTQENQRGEVIDVGRDEAEWTLDIVDRLFDYFIVDVERDRSIRAAMDKRIKEAGRKAIPPLPDDSGEEGG